VYEVVVQQFDAELLGEKLLPSLLPLTVDKSINIDQFNVIMRVVKMAIQKLEQERTSELAKRKIDIVVPLAEPTSPQEWESFEQTQSRILTTQTTAVPKTTIVQPTTKQPPRPSTTPSVPAISAISGTPLPTTGIQATPKKPSLSTTHKPTNPTPTPPSQPTSGGNLFAGLETKNITSTPSKDPFASLSDLQDIMKARPMSTPISPQPRPQQSQLLPQIQPQLQPQIQPQLQPLQPQPRPQQSQLQPQIQPQLQPLQPQPQKTESATIKPTPLKQNTPTNFSLDGLMMKPTTSSTNMDSSELFASQLNNGGDPFATSTSLAENSQFFL